MSSRMQTVMDLYTPNVVRFHQNGKSWDTLYLGGGEWPYLGRGGRNSPITLDPNQLHVLI